MLLIDTPAPCTVAGKLAAIIALLLGATPRSVFLATRSRASAGREYLLRGPSVR